MRMLIVDDNAEDRNLLKMNLEHHGCEVIEASDGAEGLHLASTCKPGMIVSDALMPVMDGFQFLRSIKTDEKLRSIPFIFYSAVYTGYKEAELATSLGAEAFIIKPKDPEELWEELKSILEECKLKKEKVITAELIEKEEEFLRKYSHIVAVKLEEKIKELEKTKVKVEEKEKCYRNLFSSLRDVVITADMDRRILDANQPALRELFGYEVEDIIGKKTRILYAEDSGYSLTGKEIFDRKVYDKGRIIEVDFRKKNDEIFHGEMFALKLTDDDGQTIGNIGLIRDITERKRMEEENKKLEAQLLQSQKMEAVGQLAGGVAHDFNNILSTIIGYGELAKMKMKEDDPFGGNLNYILEGADKAATLTRSLLAFSRKQAMDLKPLNLNEIINRVKKFLDRIIGEDIQLKTELSEYDLNIMADSGQLEQVLLNLSTNARDAMPGGGLLIIKSEKLELDDDFVTLHGFGEPGEYAFFSVTDTGKGMDEATKEKIFEPFFTTKETGKGTGLGLAMVYGIVKQHNGFINVYSEQGKGTTFKIYLPLIKAEAKQEEVAVLPYPKGGSETILVAEDNDSLRKLAQTVLESFGYKVITAEDGEDAINKFRMNMSDIKLCILDMIMPKKSGKEAYDEIKKIKPGIKVLFASGYTADIIQREGIVEEGLDFVLKPITPKDLMRKVREILDKCVIK